VLHLGEPRDPQLPNRRVGALTGLTSSAVLHAVVLIVVALVETTSTLGRSDVRAGTSAAQQKPDVQRIVFLPPELPQLGGGGGGGGNQRAEPIRRAQAVGSDAITLRVRKQPAAALPVTAAAAPVADVPPPLPAIVLDAVPLSSGILDRIGLPTGGVLSGLSTGPGTGGGAGTGSGSGFGSGRGPGLGPGSGGGVGGGVYRPGGAVTAPRVITKVLPIYTSDAFRRKVQGSIELELVVTRHGCASQIRVVRSLDHGLDDQAVEAVARWQFEPGRLSGAPVDVLVTVILDFAIR